MDDIERELQEKSIEKSDVDIQIIEQEQKRTKKTRSAAQIAAFEKARKTRAEKIAEKIKKYDQETNERGRKTK